MKLSVCMATCNGERFIGRQLATILSQLYSDDEVVVSDDSSTDGTLAIVKALADPRIRLFEGNTFFNPVFNFENALTKVTGDVIILADQDDVWLDNKVAVIRERFDRRPDPVFLVMLNGFVVDDSENVICDSIFRKLGAGQGLLKNIYNNTYIGCSLAFSRELLNIALPFPPKIPMHDVWLGLLAELFGSVEFIDKKTFMYRKHSGSLTIFKRSWMPLVQIKRRYYLTYYIMMRYLLCRKLRFKTH